MKEYGIGILGCGRMGKIHAYAYKMQPFYYHQLRFKINLVAVCDRNEEKAKETARAYGFQTYYTNWEELIKDERIDIMSNCLPTYLHAEPSMVSIENGKHVICEKPLAATISDAKRMIRVAEEGPTKTMCMFNLRFMVGIQKAKKLIDRGFIGRTYQFRSVFAKMSHLDPNRLFTWRDQTDLAGGGAFLDMGVHAADLARFLVGEVDSVCTVAKTFISGRPIKGKIGEVGKVTVDDVGIMLLKFKNGAIGSLESSKISPGHTWTRMIEIGGNKGAIAWDLGRPDVLWAYSLKAPHNLRGWRKIMVKEPGSLYPGHIAAIHHFLECLLSNKVPKESFREGLRSQEIIKAGYLSSKEEKWIKLPIV